MKLYHKNLRRNDIIKELAERTGQSKKLCEAMYSALTDVIHANIVNHNKVYLDGIGSFCIREMKELVRRIPSGVMVFKERRAKPTFTFNQSFIEHVRKTPLLNKEEYENHGTSQTLDRYT